MHSAWDRLGGLLGYTGGVHSSRSKISVDGNNLSPRNGRFRALTKRSGSDGGGEILNSQGKVIASRGVECACSSVSEIVLRVFAAQPG